MLKDEREFVEKVVDEIRSTYDVEVVVEWYRSYLLGLTSKIARPDISYCSDVFGWTKEKVNELSSLVYLFYISQSSTADIAYSYYTPMDIPAVVSMYAMIGHMARDTDDSVRITSSFDDALLRLNAPMKDACPESVFRARIEYFSRLHIPAMCSGVIPESSVYAAEYPVVTCILRREAASGNYGWPGTRDGLSFWERLSSNNGLSRTVDSHVVKEMMRAFE